MEQKYFKGDRVVFVLSNLYINLDTKSIFWYTHYERDEKVCDICS